VTAASLVELDGVAELIARSRLIGADPSLVVHGGGNTSCKTVGRDHLGRERRILVIKASGADMRTIDASGFVALYLDDLRTVLDREAMSDEAMTEFLMAARADQGPRRPSIETLLHAFLPARHVDHVHADAICALTNGPRPADTVRDALGPRVRYVAYRRPGFELAREVAAAAKDAEAVVLGHHGLVTWGATSNDVAAATGDLVARAARYLAQRHVPPAAAGEPTLAEDSADDLLLALRGRLSKEGRRVLHVDAAGRAFGDRPDRQAVLAAGAATADHLLRVRAFPIVVRDPSEVETAVARAEASARELWERHRDRAPRGTAPRDVRPVVALVPGLGTVTSGANAAEARVVAEVAARSHAVAATVIDAFGAAVPLSSEDIFDLEYWPLELAKLRAPATRDLEGRVVIVTGAASGIGRDIAISVAAAGAHVVVADLDETRAEETAEAVRASGGEARAVRTDVTNAGDVDRLVRHAIRTYGGVDGAVSNAGVAVTGRIEKLSVDEWSRSLAVNATSHFLLARRLLPAFARQSLGGSLVFVASKNAFSPGDGFGAYSVAKAAEVQLARVVAIEAGRDGVRANIVSPDAVFGGSHLWDGGLREQRAVAHGVRPEELERFYASRSLLGVSVRGSDVADAVTFCLSDKSSRMTGCVLTVDGGVAAAFPR
jgi:rhamnulose-1-phosphate aldolase/alcohol dehydrogenase